MGRVPIVSDDDSRPIGAEDEERPVLSKLDRLLNEKPATAPRLLDPHGETVELPRSAQRLFRQLTHLLAQGHTIALIPVDKELTTQQAADLLNISRPYLIQLLDAGKLPFSRTGTHRRIRFDDLMAYKRERDATRHQRLRELTQLSDEPGLYDLPALDQPMSREGNASAAALSALPDSLEAVHQPTEQRVLYFSLALALDDIPEPVPCSYCGARMQKELLSYETEAATALISAAPTPGYGCTNCGGKVFPAAVFLALLQGAAMEAERAGESSLAIRLMKEHAFQKAAQNRHHASSR